MQTHLERSFFFFLDSLSLCPFIWELCVLTTLNASGLLCLFSKHICFWQVWSSMLRQHLQNSTNRTTDVWYYTACEKVATALVPTVESFSSCYRGQRYCVREDEEVYVGMAQWHMSVTSSIILSQAVAGFSQRCRRSVNKGETAGFLGRYVHRQSGQGRTLPPGITPTEGLTKTRF